MENQPTTQDRERNAILTRVYNNPVVDHILIWGGKGYPDFIRSFLKEDFKQEVFSILAQKPLSLLIDLEANGKILKFISTMVKMESATVWRKFQENPIDEYEEPVHGDILHDEPSFAENKMDLYDACVKELDAIPYTEKNAFLLFSEMFNEIAVWRAQKEMGFHLTKEGCINSIKKNRDIIQESLLRKQIINRKVKFSLHARFANLGRYNFSTLRAGEMMLDIIFLLGEKYDAKMSLRQKLLHAFIYGKNPLTSIDFYDYIKTHEGVSYGDDVNKTKKQFTSAMLSLLASGIFYDERTQGYTLAACRKYYGIRKSVYEYIHNLVDSGLPLSREQLTKWKIFIYRERSFYTYDHISKLTKIDKCDVIRIYNEASNLISDLGEARKKEEYLKK